MCVGVSHETSSDCNQIQRTQRPFTSPKPVAGSSLRVFKAERRAEVGMALWNKRVAG